MLAACKACIFAIAYICIGATGITFFSSYVIGISITANRIAATHRACISAITYVGVASSRIVALFWRI